MENTKGSRLLMWLLICLVAFVYIRYNTKRTRIYEVLQVTPANLTFEVLNERNPVVVRKGEKDANDIIRDAMRYTYMFTNHLQVHDNKSDADFKEVIGRYEVFVALRPMEIEVIHPGHVGKTDYKSISLKLDGKSIAILPTYWAYRIEGELKDQHVADIVTVHDTFSAIRSMLFVKHNE